MPRPSMLAALSFLSHSLAQPTRVHTLALGNTTCTGKDPDFDQGCAAFNTEAECEQQAACTWGEVGKSDCFAKNGDPVIDQECKKITNATLCADQIGCTWRSDGDRARWVAAITGGVTSLAANETQIPPTVGLFASSYTSAYDHKQVIVADLPATLTAWVVKYGLPAGVTTGMQALVATESAEYKSYHVVLSGGDGVLDEVAAGGRNWGGVVSLAFVRARVTASVTKYYLNVYCNYNDPNGPYCYSGTCEWCHLPCGPGQYVPGTPCPERINKCQGTGPGDCPLNVPDPSRAFTSAENEAIIQQLQSWNYPKLAAENVLLKDEILAPTLRSHAWTTASVVV